MRPLPACQDCSRSGAWQRALQVVADPAVASDDLCVNTMLGVLARAGLWQRALAFFGRSLRQRSSVVALNTVLKALGDRRAARTVAWSHALSLARRAARGADGGLAGPDRLTYTAAMNAVGQAGRWRTVLALLSEATATGDTTRDCRAGAAWHREVGQSVDRSVGRSIGSCRDSCLGTRLCLRPRL